MKVFKILLIFLFISNYGFSQRRGQVVKWFSIAGKGGVGNSILLNTDVINEKGADLDLLSLSYAYGGRFTFSYGQNLGFGVELMMNNLSQKYAMKQGAVAYEKTMKINTLDYTLFFRYKSNSRGYFEVGPTFSNVKKIEETNSIQNSSFLDRSKISESYQDKYVSLMLGFGMTAYRTERLDINIGLRASYSFKDFEDDPNYYVLNDGVFKPSVISDKSTNPLSVKVLFELNYYFAFWGNASCGRGRFMLFQ